MLYRITVYEVDRVVVEWSIELPGGDALLGRPESGQFKAHVVDNCLNIYVPRKSDVTSYVPIDLIEYLAQFCEIHDPARVMLLQYILMEADMAKVSEALNRRGILSDGEFRESSVGMSVSGF